MEVFGTSMGILKIIFGKLSDIFRYYMAGLSLKILALQQQKSHSLVWMLHIHEYHECVVTIQEASTCGIHICAKYYYCQHDFVFLNLIAGFL